MVDDEDAAVMARFVAGRNRADFDVLFRRHRDRVYAHALRIVKNPSRAEELAQEVFVKVYTVKKYEPSAKFRTYVLRITTNLCLNELRRAEHRHVGPSLGTPEEQSSMPSRDAVDPHAALEGARLREHLTGAIERLPENQRAALLLARHENMTQQEIASTMSTTVSAVKSLVHRAVQTLRKEAEQIMEASDEAPLKEVSS